MKKNNKVTKIILIVALVLIIVFGVYYFINTKTDNQSGEEFIKCLADAGVVIYGSSTCPACARLLQEYDEYKIIKSIYVDCSGVKSEQEAERCEKEVKTGFVPEIQINGQVFNEWGSPDVLARETGCKL